MPDPTGQCSRFFRRAEALGREKGDKDEAEPRRTATQSTQSITTGPRVRLGARVRR